MKKVIACIICLVCCISSSAFIVNAEEAVAIEDFNAKDASLIISNINIVTTPIAGGTINASIAIDCYEKCSSLGFISFAIQEYDGGWSNVVTTTNRFTTNAYTYGITLTYSGAVAGRQYRTVASSSATFGTTEYRNSTSSTVIGK